jgi:hypothetical protein
MHRRGPTRCGIPHARDRRGPRGPAPPNATGLHRACWPVSPRTPPICSLSARTCGTRSQTRSTTTPSSPRVATKRRKPGASWRTARLAPASAAALRSAWPPRSKASASVVKKSRSDVSRWWRWKPASAPPPVRKKPDSCRKKASSRSFCMAVSLSREDPKPFPAPEEELPER